MKLHRIFFLLFVPFFLLAGDGLRGSYYNKTSTTYNTYPISGTPITRTDATVNFSWGSSPATGINADNFQAQWTGFIQIPTSGTWTFYTQSDDGVRLTINGQNLISNWADHSSTENSASLTLSAGYYPIVMEFYERGGAAVAQLRWQGPSTSKAIIPQTYLFTAMPSWFIISDVNITEGNTSYSMMNFAVTLLNSANASVQYATSDGTATAGSDYNATSGTLTFTAGGATTQTISVPIVGDRVIENNETVYVTLSNPINATISDGNAIGTIFNDDVPDAYIQFQQSIYQTSENTALPFETSSIMSMTITLSQAIDDNVTVQFTTQDGTAIGTNNSGKDYISQTGVLTIPAGDTNITLPMYIIHDQPIENLETFTVQLSTPTPSTRIQLGTNHTATVQILEQLSAPMCYSDNFQTPLDNKWRTLFSSGNFTPQIDQGHLRLTPGRTSISTAVTKDYEFPSKENLIVVEFDHYAYGGCFEQSTPVAGLGTYGADGIVAVLYDSAVGPSPTPGAYGGSMGYAQGHGLNGFQGGWLGLGLDEYGNFANPTEGRVGGPGFHTNAAVIRGDGTGTIGYEFLAEAYPLATPIAPIVDITNPDKLPADKFKMTVDARNSSHLYIKLERDTNDGTGYQTIINNFDAKLAAYNQGATPDYVRFALTAGTGGGCNAHEIDNLTVRGNCSAYIPSLTGAFRVTEDNSNASWSTKWLKKNLTTKVASLNHRYCVLSGTSPNDSATPYTANVNVDINLTDGSGFNQQVAHNLALPAASATTCFDVSVNNRASRAMWFVISNPNDATMTSTSDAFSIRPDTFVVDINEPNPRLLAGKNYRLDIKARSITSDNSVDDYTTTLNNVFQTAVPSMATCPNNDTFQTPLVFNNGISQLNPFSYPDVMDINFTIIDEDWTAIDQAKGDCMPGSYSSSSTPVGCLIKKIEQFQFVPDHFEINASLTNYDNNFTYISSDLNMSANLELNITAQNRNNNRTKSYTSNCYAKTTDYNISYDANITNGMLSRIKFFGISDDVNISGDSLLGAQLDFNINRNLFTIDQNGTGRLNLKLNFDRNQTQALNPFRLRIRDINISDSDDVNGTLTLDQNATFYYGRVHAPDQRFSGTAGTANIYYEVYCRNCTNAFRTNMGITGNQSVDAVNWYQNNLHVNNTFGEFNSTVVTATSNGLTLGARTLLTQNLTAGSTPHVNRVNFGSSSWLRFYPEYFKVEFVRPGNWAGEGSVDRNQTAGRVGGFAHENNVTRAHRRMNW